MSDLVQKFGYVSDAGSYNFLPDAPMTEITEDEFWNKWFMYSPIYVEHRQVFDKKERAIKGVYARLYTCRILWFDDEAIVVFQGEYSGGGVHAKPKFFKLGCKHEYENVISRMCYRESKCKKCGHINIVDSSD